MGIRNRAVSTGKAAGLPRSRVQNLATFLRLNSYKDFHRAPATLILGFWRRPPIANMGSVDVGNICEQTPGPSSSSVQLLAKLHLGLC